MKDLTTDWTSDGMGTGDGMMGSSSAVMDRHGYLPYVWNGHK